MRHSMKPDLRADYKIRLYTGPQNPFFEVSTIIRLCRDGHMRYRCLRRLGKSGQRIELAQRFSPIEMRDCISSGLSVIRTSQLS